MQHLQALRLFRKKNFITMLTASNISTDSILLNTDTSPFKETAPLNAPPLTPSISSAPKSSLTSSIHY